MLQDGSLDNIISWDATGKSIVVKNERMLETKALSLYFDPKTNKACFHRQLVKYGFKKHEYKGRTKFTNRCVDREKLSVNSFKMTPEDCRPPKPDQKDIHMQTISMSYEALEMSQKLIGFSCACDEAKTGLLELDGCLEALEKRIEFSEQLMTKIGFLQ